MASLRRPLVVALGVLVVVLLAAVVAQAVGADAVSLVLGAAVVASAMAILVVALQAPRRQDRVTARREKRARSDRSHQERATARKIGAAIETSELRLFRQLEALGWLRDTLALSRPLPPTRGYAAAPDLLLRLVGLVDRDAPQLVLELGSGVSTIVIARRLQQAGRGRLVTLDHLPEYAAATRSELAAHGLTEVATVVDAPLADVRLDDETWSWYQLGGLETASFDLLFIDGPPAGTGPLARYPALPLLRDRLAPGALVLLDDGDRPDEQETVRRWLAETEGLRADHLPLTKGAWLLTLPRG